MKVIGFCGLPGAGKSEAIKAIETIGPVITMGDVIRNEAKKRNIEPTGANLGALAKKLREEHGEDIIAEKCVSMINNQDSDMVFVDGLRSMSEVNVFRKSWKFPIVAITLNDQLRYQRLNKRGRSDDPLTFEAFKERDEREISFGLKEVINKSNYDIDNNISVAELHKKIKKLILKIIKKY